MSNPTVGKIGVRDANRPYRFERGEGCDRPIDAHEHSLAGVAANVQEAKLGVETASVLVDRIDGNEPSSSMLSRRCSLFHCGDEQIASVPLTLILTA